MLSSVGGAAQTHHQCTKEGEKYFDGCNNCICVADPDNSGEFLGACTRRLCGCKYGGKTYASGEKFTAIDGCNTCTYVYYSLLGSHQLIIGGRLGFSEQKMISLQFYRKILLSRKTYISSHNANTVLLKQNSITVLLTRSHQCRRLVQKRPSMCYHVYAIVHVKDPS